MRINIIFMIAALAGIACQPQSTSKTLGYQDISSIVPEVKDGKSTGNDIVNCKDGSVETVPHTSVTSEQVCAEKSDRVFTQLVTKDMDGCALDQNGKLDCWGIEIPNDLGVIKKVALASDHACVINASQRVYCFGSNADLQLTVPESLILSNDIAVSYTGSCAVDTGNKVVCWGGKPAASMPPAALQGKAAKIFSGEENYCALTVDGGVSCWGADASINAAPTLSKQLSISVGVHHACSLDESKKVTCWGKNIAGEGIVPSDLGSVNSIAVGAQTTCAILANGSSRCWGANDYSQSYVPASLGSLQSISPSFSRPNYLGNTAHYNFQQNCGITAKGDVRCWTGETLTSPTHGVKAKKIWAGGASTCAINDNYETACWGYETRDRPLAGMYFDEQRAAPGGFSMATEHFCSVSSDYIMCQGKGEFDQAYPPQDQDGNTAKVFTGDNFNCQVKKDGSVSCWGDSRSGATTVPQDLGTVQKVAIGAQHACALKTDGTIRCWGGNEFGQLLVPSSLGAAKDIQAAGSHTCAIDQQDKVQCWGRDSENQTLVPSELGEALEVVTGQVHSCAIRKSDRKVLCWGGNADGQSKTPKGIGAVSQITAGSRHNCAIRQDDQTVHCWGANNFSQLEVPKYFPQNNSGAYPIPNIQNGTLVHKDFDRELVTTTWVGSSHGGYYAAWVPSSPIASFTGLKDYAYSLDVSYNNSCGNNLVLTINNGAPIPLEKGIITISRDLRGPANMYLRSRGQIPGSFSAGYTPESCSIQLVNVAVKPGSEFLEQLKGRSATLTKSLDILFNAYLRDKHWASLQGLNEKAARQAMERKLEELVRELKYALEDSGKYPEDYKIDAGEWSNDIILSGIAVPKLVSLRREDGTMGKPVTQYDFKAQAERAPWFKDLMKNLELRAQNLQREDDYIGYLAFLLPAQKIIGPSDEPAAVLKELDKELKDAKEFLDMVFGMKTALDKEFAILVGPLNASQSVAAKRCEEQSRRFEANAEGRYECN